MDKLQLYDGKTQIEIISVICMFKNNEQYIKDFFFESVLNFEQTYEVQFDYFIIENNSRDNTRELLKTFFKTKSRKSKLLLFDMEQDFKNIGDGRNYERLYNLAFIRNKLVNAITPLSSNYCLFIDSNIYFKVDILQKMFSINPSQQNIGMIVPYTQQLFIPQIHKIPNISQPTLLQHYYDTFSFYDENSKTFWPYCAFEKCKLCNRQDCMDRKSVPESQVIVDVNCAFGGFCLIRTDIINNKLIRWDTISYDIKKDESICEHFLFCHMLKKLTNQRIVILQNVDEIYRTF